MLEEVEEEGGDTYLCSLMPVIRSHASVTSIIPTPLPELLIYTLFIGQMQAKDVITAYVPLETPMKDPSFL